MDASVDAQVDEFLAQLNPALPKLPAVIARLPLRADVAVVSQALSAAGLDGSVLCGPGLLILAVPDAEWMSALCRCATKHGALDGVRGPPTFMLQRVTKDSDPRAMAAETMGGGLPAILVEVDGESLIPADVLRSADMHLRVIRLSWSDCLAVAARLTCDGRRVDLPYPANLDRLTPAMWLLAHRPEQSAGELLRRVIEIAGPAPARPGVPALRLTDCPGMGEASTWGTDMSDDLRAYAAGDLAWSDLDRGALLYGPPGCGKTRFAGCLAGSAGVPLFASSVTDWSSEKGGNLNDFLGSMKSAFALARASAPCILFIDELDAVGLRGQGGHNASWTSAAVAGLLEAMDGADRREGVVVVAATNDLAGVDPALRRSGRLDRCIEVGMPTAEGLNYILRVHLAGDLLYESLIPVAEQAVGGTGADCERWVREARRRARVARRPLCVDDLVQVVKPAGMRASIGFGR